MVKNISVFHKICSEIEFEFFMDKITIKVSTRHTLSMEDCMTFVDDEKYINFK